MALMLVVICLALSVTDASPKSKPVIKWKLLTNPIRFGGSLILNCTTSYKEKCSSEIHRIWTKGNDNDLIFNNGVLGKKYGNSSKYSEQTSDSCKDSSLIVTAVNEKDFNIPYTCSFGYPGTNNTSIWVSRTDLLSLNNTEYEYLPSEDMLESWEIKKGGQSKFFARIEKIYPVPNCTMYIQGQYQSDLNIKTEKNSLFFSVDMFTDYLIGDYLPTEDWCIHCTVNDLDFSIMNNGSKSLVCGIAKEDPLVIIQVVLGVLYTVFILIDFLDDVCFRFWKCDNPLAKTTMSISFIVWMFVIFTDVFVIPMYLSFSGHSRQGFQSTARSEQTTENVNNIVGTFHIAYIVYKLVVFCQALKSLNEIDRKAIIFFMNTSFMNMLCLRIIFTIGFIETIREYIPKTTLDHVIRRSLMLIVLESCLEIQQFIAYPTCKNNKANRSEEYITEEHSEKEPVSCHDIATDSASSNSEHVSLDGIAADSDSSDSGTKKVEISTAISQEITEPLQLKMKDEKTVIMDNTTKDPDNTNQEHAQPVYVKRRDVTEETGATDNSDSIPSNNSDTCSQEDDYNKDNHKNEDSASVISTDSTGSFHSAQSKSSSENESYTSIDPLIQDTKL